MIYFIFYFVLSNFADDITPYVCDKNLAFVLAKSEHGDIILNRSNNL